MISKMKNAQPTLSIKMAANAWHMIFHLSIFPFTDCVIVNQMIFSHLSKILGQFWGSLRPLSRNSDNVRLRDYHLIGCDSHLQSNSLYSVVFFQILC